MRAFSLPNINIKTGKNYRLHCRITIQEHAYLGGVKILVREFPIKEKDAGMAQSTKLLNSIKEYLNAKSCGFLN